MCDLERSRAYGATNPGLMRWENDAGRGYFEHPSYVPLVRRAYENWRELESLTGETVLTVTRILEAGKPGGMLVSGSLEACRLHGLDHELLDPVEVARRFPAIRLPENHTAMF